MQFDEFLGVLDLLKDPVKYEQKVNELKAHNQAIQDSIAQMGVTGDVVKAQAKADRLVAKAEAALASAQTEADILIANARTVYNSKFEELRQREVVADQAIANYNTIKAQTGAREQELRQAEKAAEALKAVLAAQQAELNVKQAEVEERLAKLRQVMG